MYFYLGIPDTYCVLIFDNENTISRFLGILYVSTFVLSIRVQFFIQPNRLQKWLTEKRKKLRQIDCWLKNLAIINRYFFHIYKQKKGNWSRCEVHSSKIRRRVELFHDY